MKTLKDKYSAILRDNRTRSVLKAISYRILSMFITFLISLMVTGSYKIAFTIGGIDVTSKVLFYYLHERIWHRSKIGRRT